MMPLLIMTCVVYLIEHSIFFMVFFFTIIYISSLIQNEEKNHTDILYRSLPVRSSSIVYSRYIAASVVFAGVFLPAFLACSLIDALDIPGRTGSSLVITVTGFFTIAVPIAVLVAGIFPFYFKYGYVKGMLLGSVASILTVGTLAVILYIIFSLSGKTGILTAIMAKTDNYWIVRFLLGVFAQAATLMGKEFFLVFISIVTVILLAVSVKVSVKFYKNRDL
jgi:ABC-2 type transport system permease protein